MVGLEAIRKLIAPLMNAPGVMRKKVNSAASATTWLFALPTSGHFERTFKKNTVVICSLNPEFFETISHYFSYRLVMRVFILIILVGLLSAFGSDALGGPQQSSPDAAGYSIKPQQPSKTTAQSLKTIFTVLFALALGEAFKQFVAEESLNRENPIDLHWDRLPALFAFLVLIFPFYQGTLEYFDQTYLNDSGGLRFGFKDFIGVLAFVFEGGLFFVMSRALPPRRYVLFYGAAAVLLTANVPWLWYSWRPNANGGPATFWDELFDWHSNNCFQGHCAVFNTAAVTLLVVTYWIGNCWKRSRGADTTLVSVFKETASLAKRLSAQTELDLMKAQLQQLHKRVLALREVKNQLVTRGHLDSVADALTEAIAKSDQIVKYPSADVLSSVRKAAERAKIEIDGIVSGLSVAPPATFYGSLRDELSRFKGSLKQVEYPAWGGMAILTVRTMADYLFNRGFYFP